VLAERAGLRIHEVPVDWVDDADSRVDLLATAIGDLRGIARLSRDLVRFALVGVASTLAYLVLYLAFRAPLGAQAANAISLLLTAVANTAANRRWTFEVRGAVGACCAAGRPIPAGCGRRCWRCWRPPRCCICGT